MSAENFEQFRTFVLNDLELQKQLQNVEDKDKFISRTVALGEREGFEFSAEDVKTAMRESKRERWV